MIHSPDCGYGLVHILSHNIALKLNFSKILRPPNWGTFIKLWLSSLNQLKLPFCGNLLATLY